MSADDDGFDGGAGEPSTGVPVPVGQLKVRINEVMVANTSTLADPEGRFSPWIELYNPGDAPVDLAGVPLSDDLVQSGKWALPRATESVIPARGYLVVFCDGGQSGAGLHAPFTLKPGFLQLVLNKGSDLFFTDTARLGPDESAGRFPDGTGAIARLESPTPGAANAGPAPPKEGTFVRGDANGDGRVNITDVTTILGVLYQGKPTPSCEDRLDADDSGHVDLQDPVYTSDALFRHGPALPPPFPVAGEDPTPDDLPCPAGR